MNNKLIAVITGGSRGIGLALVKRFIVNGYTVFTCSRERPTDEIIYNENLKWFKADFSEPKEVLAFADFVLDSIGKLPVNVLINNVGVFKPGSIQTEENGILENLFQINVAATYHFTRSIIPVIERGTSGIIINICSTASIEAYVNGGSYCITKFALLGFSKVLRAELMSKNIAVTAVMPGATLTDSWQGTDFSDNRFISADDLAILLYSISQLPPTAVVEEVIIRPMLGDID